MVGFTQGEFDSLLKRVESEGVAKFIHHQDRYGGGWGSDTVEIQNVDWNRFDKYYKELKDEAHVKKLDLNLWNLVNLFWIIYGRQNG